MEVATGRAHLVGTTSGSNSTSHATLSSWLIVCSFTPTKLLRKPWYGAFHLFAKTPRGNPTEYPTHQHRCLGMGSAEKRKYHTNNNPPAAEVSQAVPATPFGDQRCPLLPSTENENRSYKLAPWPTPSRRSKDFYKLEDYKSAP